MEEAKIHVRFSAILYRMQAREGRYCLHEHPRTATSWKMPEIHEMLAMPDAIRVESDQCRFGLETVVNSERLLAKKPISFGTNSWAIARELGKKCTGNHKHGHLMEGRDKAAAVHPPE